MVVFLNVSTAKLAHLFAQILKLYPHIPKGNSFFFFPCELAISDYDATAFIDCVKQEVIFSYKDT